MASTVRLRRPVRPDVRQKDTMTNKTRGLLFLAVGTIIPFLFLFGGGIVSSGNGAQLTSVFIAIYLLGILITTPLIFRSKPQLASEVKPRTFTARILGVIFPVIFMLLVMMFFKSRAFASNFGQYAFIIFTGFALSCFIPLGLLHMRADNKKVVPARSNTDS